MHLTAEHDGRLVADIVAEWASIHGQPFELVLDGPAGGKFSQGVDGERVEIDAVDFVRTLSGRLPGAGVLSNPLPLSSAIHTPTQPTNNSNKEKHHVHRDHQSTQSPRR